MKHQIELISVEGTDWLDEIRQLFQEYAQSLRQYRFIRLDTAPSMQKTQLLHQAFGFYDIEPYVFNPLQGARYMELKLEV